MSNRQLGVVQDRMCDDYEHLKYVKGPLRSDWGKFPKTGSGKNALGLNNREKERKEIQKLGFSRFSPSFDSWLGAIRLQINEVVKKRNAMKVH